MPRRRSLEAMEKDARAADYYRRGFSYRQIARELEWASPKSAFDAVRRAAHDAARDSLAKPEALRMMLERQQDYRRIAMRVVATRHYKVTPAGNIAKGPDGQPLLDDDPVMAALDRLHKIDDMEAKLMGLYAPAQSRVQVITEDTVDAEIARLAREIGDAGAQGVPELEELSQAPAEA